MQVIIKSSRERRADSAHLCQVGDSGAHDTLQAAEVLEERATLRRAQPRHHFQHRLVVTPCALLAVAGDGKAVCLIADALDQP